MTRRFWATAWRCWLAAIAVSFAGLESAAVVCARRSHAGSAEDFTLSDTIRRWALSWRPLAAIVSGGMIWLLVHLFVTGNP